MCTLYLDLYLSTPVWIYSASTAHEQSHIAYPQPPGTFTTSDPASPITHLVLPRLHLLQRLLYPRPTCLASLHPCLCHPCTPTSHQLQNPNAERSTPTTPPPQATSAPTTDWLDQLHGANHAPSSSAINSAPVRMGVRGSSIQWEQVIPCLVRMAGKRTGIGKLGLQA